LTPADTTEKVEPLTKDEVTAIAARSSGFNPGPPGLKSSSSSSSEDKKSEEKEP